jgi:hypothetical protein
MVVAFSALFVALGGVGVAATGDNFILGQSNSATTATTLSSPVDAPGLAVTNTSVGANATALSLTSAASRPPMKVNSAAKVANLNVDRIDNLDSSAFLRRGVLQSNNVTTAGGVVDATNTGTTNGVQGKTGSAIASGVYGENTGGGGYGVAGRAGSTGNAIYGDNTGSGFAGYFEDKVHVGGNVDVSGDLQCAGCVGASDISGKVDDSEKLDGLDSADFIQGHGKAGGQALAEAPGVHLFLGPPLQGFLRLSYACPGSLASNGVLRIYNDSGSLANVFVESGDPNPSYSQLAPGGTRDLPASSTGDSFHIQAQGALGVQTIEVATVHRPSSNDCHAQAQGVLAG